MTKKRSVADIVSMFALFLITLVNTSCKKNPSGETTPPSINPPVPPNNFPAPPDSLRLNKFYKKYVDAGGIPIISSEYTQDEALLKAKETVVVMMAYLSDSVKAQMFSVKARVGILSQYENLTDLPEYRGISRSMNDRARGYGSDYNTPLCSTAEENVLCGKTQLIDKWFYMDVLTHEFAHCIHMQGLIYGSPGFDSTLQKTFEAARAKGLWEGCYAATNHREYWAEGVGLWFNCNEEALPAELPNRAGTRENLKAYDPDLYNLIAKYFTPAMVKNGCH